MRTHKCTLVITALLALTLVVPAPAQVVPTPPSPPRQPVVIATGTRNAHTNVVGSIFQGQSAKPRIFVVPTGQRKPEDLRPVFEDLHVMCRIFDKRLNPRTTAFASRSEAANLLAAMTLNNKRAGETEALYLDGYGVVFFVNVAFPLILSEGKREQEAQAQPEGDPLWQRVREETLHGNQEPAEGPDARETERVNREATSILTATLIQTLKHAANIRSLKASQNIIIRITGNDEPRRRRSRSRGGRGPYGEDYGVATSQANESSFETALIIRTTKADVDDFSNGTLTFEQFKAKAEVIAMDTPSADSAPTIQLGVDPMYGEGRY